MSSFDRVSLTIGHIARHTPTGSGSPGREAAIIDIAQDLLLAYLEENGMLEDVVIKGGVFKTKMDFGPRPWLEPVYRSFSELPIHKQYGLDLPKIKMVRLEENMAEKIARLNRTNTARDLYDLNWIMETPSVERIIDKPLLRRLAVLKIWVDSHGMHCGNVWWRPAHAPSVFDPEKWLYGRNPKEIDREDIGTLAVPAPTAEEMLSSLKENYLFLMDLDETETVIAGSNAKDRSLVIQTLKELPGGRLSTGLF